METIDCIGGGRDVGVKGMSKQNQELAFSFNAD